MIFILICAIIMGVFSAKPNFIIVMTDDQDYHPHRMKGLDFTENFFRENGKIFENAFTTTPLCCPSRASFLTGKYPHNHRVFNNSVSGGCYNREWIKTQEPVTMGPYMKKLGYHTFYAGKYLNTYGMNLGKFVRAGVPPGYDWWMGQRGNALYYDYHVIINGTSTYFGHEDRDYFTTVLSESSQNFLRIQNKNNPFFMMITPAACHSQPFPDPLLRSYYNKTEIQKDKSFNVPQTQDKHWLMREFTGPLSDHQLDDLELLHKRRTAALEAVDNMMKKIITTLTEMDLLSNTYIIYTSDHGFHIGQFSLFGDKRLPYESDIRIPLYISGPLVNETGSVPEVVLNIDVMPTVVDLAGGEPPADVDGRSLERLLTGKKKGLSWREDFLIEYWGSGTSKPQRKCSYKGPGLHGCKPLFNCRCHDALNNTYNCLRTLSRDENSLFCRFLDNENYIEHYDMTKDPEQLHNIKTPLEFPFFYDQDWSILHLKTCRSESCRSPPRVNRPFFWRRSKDYYGQSRVLEYKDNISS